MSLLLGSCRKQPDEGYGESGGRLGVGIMCLVYFFPSKALPLVKESEWLVSAVFTP